MEVRSCRKCGKMYNYLGLSTPLCPSCMKVLEDKFDQVKAYIYDHPLANIQDVSQENEVPVKQITAWIREERLSFAENSPIALDCEGCGAKILTGRFCNSCKARLTTEIGNVYKRPTVQNTREKDKKEKARMRFLDNSQE